MEIYPSAMPYHCIPMANPPINFDYPLYPSAFPFRPPHSHLQLPHLYPPCAHPYPAYYPYHFVPTPPHDPSRHCCGFPNHVSNPEAEKISEVHDENPYTMRLSPAFPHLRPGCAQGDRAKNQPSFPVIWIPPSQSLNNGAGKVGDFVDEIRSCPRKEELPSKVKVIPVTQSRSEDQLKCKDIVEEKAINCREGSRTSDLDVKPMKQSKLPPVCLRIDPLPKGKNGNGSSTTQILQSQKPSAKDFGRESSIRKEIEVKEKLQDAKKLDRAAMIPSSEKLNCMEEGKGAVDESRSKVYLSETDAAIAIQSIYRGFLVRKWKPIEKLKAIWRVNQQVCQIREKVRDLEAVSGQSLDNKKKMVLGETIMKLLLELDVIQGLHPVVREIRKSVVRELVCLQEKLDSLAKLKIEDAQLDQCELAVNESAGFDRREQQMVEKEGREVDEKFHMDKVLVADEPASGGKLACEQTEEDSADLTNFKEEQYERLIDLRSSDLEELNDCSFGTRGEVELGMKPCLMSGKMGPNDANSMLSTVLHVDMTKEQETPSSGNQKTCQEGENLILGDLSAQVTQIHMGDEQQHGKVSTIATLVTPETTICEVASKMEKKQEEVSQNDDGIADNEEQPVGANPVQSANEVKLPSSPQEDAAALDDMKVVGEKIVKEVIEMMDSGKGHSSIQEIVLPIGDAFSIQGKKTQTTGEGEVKKDASESQTSLPAEEFEDVDSPAGKEESSGDLREALNVQPTDEGKKWMEENLELRKLLEGLLASGKKQMEAISALEEKVKDLRRMLARRKRFKLNRHRIPASAVSTN